MLFQRHRLLAKASLLFILLLTSTVIFGCARTGAVPVGWSGGVVADGTLFLGSRGGSVVALDASSGARVWQTNFTLESQAPANIFSCTPGTASVAIYGTPAVAGDSVYVGGYDGRLYAISSDGTRSASAYLDEGNHQPIVGSPVVSQGRVYIGSADGNLYALDAVSLKEEWKFPTGDKIWSTPVIVGETVFIASFDKKLYAINAADGREKWEFATEGAIVSTPLVYDDTVYISSFDRHLYAVDAANGNLKWKSDFIAGKWFWAGVVAYNKMVYAPSLDGKVYIVDAATGEKIAAPDLKAPISSAPVVIDRLVVIAADNGVIYKVDTDDNLVEPVIRLETQQGKEEKINAPLAVGNGVVFVHTQTKQQETVYAVSPETRRIVWQVPLTSQ